ncbi:MAG TPA: hypothetical protein DGG95_09545 [Cytophagales bacterium]|jgi:hypothetical protein|nr:hypothetical protein [Cytophagales bacterium]
MIGTYKIHADNINEMKGAYRFSFIKFVIIAYAIFASIIIGKHEPDMFSHLFIVTSVFVGMLLLFLIINAFQHRPIYNTIIQITENEIIRSGENLLTVRLRYDEIGTIQTNVIGTVLVKKGILAHLDLNMPRGQFSTYRPYSDSSNVILIPISIENYQKIVNYVRDRVK